MATNLQKLNYSDVKRMFSQAEELGGKSRDCRLVINLQEKGASFFEGMNRRKVEISLVSGEETVATAAAVSVASAVASLLELLDHKLKA